MNNLRIFLNPAKNILFGTIINVFESAYNMSEAIYLTAISSIIFLWYNITTG